MIRVLLVAALTVAVAGVAVAAVEDGRVERTATRLDAAADRIARAAGLLVDRADPTAPGVPGARRVVAVVLPERSLGAAPVGSVAVYGDDGGKSGGWVRYRVRGGRPTRVRVPVDLCTPEGPVVLRGSGRRRLVLRLVGPPPAVLVQRANATS